MTRLGVALALVLHAASVGAQGTTEACDRGGVLSAAGIGPVRVGMSIDSLVRVCRIIERRRNDLWERSRLRVRIGTDTAVVWEDHGRVGWIETTSPVHRTRDSLGVGSPVERLLDLPDINGGVGEGADGYVVYPRSGEHCGLSFWLDSKAAEAVARSSGDIQRRLGMRGAGGFVAEIHVRGVCANGKQS